MWSILHSPLGLLSFILVTEVLAGDIGSSKNFSQNNLLNEIDQHFPVSLLPFQQNTIERGRWARLCPFNCTCTLVTYSDNQRLRTINCSNADFWTMPNISSELDADTEALILSGNKLEIIKELPNLRKLKVLDLSNNRISKFDSHWQFVRYELLEELILRNNRLKSLQHGAFSGLKSLRSLDLSYNHLHSIEKDAFGGLNGLQVLNLDGNRLETINPDWFQRIKSVSELCLSYNNLRKINAEVFQELQHLSKLNLTGNQITMIDSNAFHGLDNLCVLDLSKNRLSAIPTLQIQHLYNLRILILDANSFETIKADEFRLLNISELSLSFLPQLTSVKNNAFHHLPKLMILHMHDNENLIFIHPYAFNHVPQLHRLYLHNNKLPALPYPVRDNLPYHTNIHLYHNPLRCDCNIRWVKEEILNYNKSKVQFHDPDKLICDYPPNDINKLLRGIPLSKIPKACPPTTLPLFPKSSKIPLGEDIFLECYAIGVPLPRISWSLPRGVVINQTSAEERVEIGDSILYMKFARPNDSGTYMCIAQNSAGNDTSSTAVQVLSGRLNMITGKTSNTYITIILNGSESIMLLDRYQIHYRESGKTDSYNVIYLKSRMHRCTITGLKPHTMYELCILYGTNAELLKLHCINVTTKREADPSGIIKIVDPKVVMGVIAAASIMLTVMCFIAVARRFRKRKDYEEPFGLDKMEPLSHIPLENLCNPPSTPICSSRTSLISHSQA